MLRPLLTRATPRLLRAASPYLPRQLRPLTPLTTIRTAQKIGPSPSVQNRPRPAPPPPAQEPDTKEFEIDESETDSESRDHSGRVLVIAFSLVAVPLSLALSFPSRMLPPVPDPEHLKHLSSTKLTLGTWMQSPWETWQVFVFRLRRGEYVMTLRKNFTFSPINYLGFSAKPNDIMKLASGQGAVPEQWRWWTWGTYMFAHAVPVHLGFCLVAMSSLVSNFTMAYGLARTAAMFFGGGIGAAALSCQIESWRHGAMVREGKGVHLEQQKQTTPSGKTVTVNVLSADPGFRQVFASNMGSSGGLMAMMAVCAVAMPQSRWGVMFLPWQFSARSMMVALVGWDLAGAFGVTPDLGIGHIGHLCGDVVGLMMYALWLRRLPVSQFLARARRRQGYW